MLNGVSYYHGIVRKVIVAFGRLFSDIKVVRYDKEGNPLQTIAVPIAYAPREKWTARLEGDPSLNNTVYNVLPRLSFEIVGYNYDSERALNKMIPIYCNDETGSKRKQVLTPTPYDININLYALTKTSEDGLTILEQILPIFKPDYTLAIRAITDLNVVLDIPIILNGVSVDDQYEGDFETRRVITHTFNFTVKANLFGASSEVNLINKVIANLETREADPTGKSQYIASANNPADEIKEAWTLMGEDNE